MDGATRMPLRRLRCLNPAWSWTPGTLSLTANTTAFLPSTATYLLLVLLHLHLKDLQRLTAILHDISEIIPLHLRYPRPIKVTPSGLAKFLL